MREPSAAEVEAVIAKTVCVLLVTFLAIMFLGGCAAVPELPALPFVAAPVPPVEVPELDRGLVEPPPQSDLAERVCPQVPRSWWEQSPVMPSFFA